MLVLLSFLVLLFCVLLFFFLGFAHINVLNLFDEAELHDLMESKGGKKKSSSSSSKSSLFYEAPLGYSIEDVRPNGGIKKFRSAAYSNVSFTYISHILYAFLIWLICDSLNNVQC